MKDATIFVDTLYALIDLTQEHIKFLIQRQRNPAAGVEELTYVMEDPRSAKRSAADHHAIDAKLFEGIASLLGSGDIAIAYDGYLHARVILERLDQSPVSLAGIHLRTSAAMHGEGLDATILEHRSQVGDDLILAVPAEPSFDRHGERDGIDHLASDIEQLGDIPEHTGAGTFGCDLLDGTPEIEVDYIGVGTLHDLCRLHHSLRLAAINLDSHRPFTVVDSELADSRRDVSDESLGRNELSEDHSGTLLMADEAERGVGDILHRGEEDRAIIFSYIKHFKSTLKRGLGGNRD